MKSADTAGRMVVGCHHWVGSFDRDTGLRDCRGRGNGDLRAGNGLGIDLMANSGTGNSNGNAISTSVAMIVNLP